MLETIRNRAQGLVVGVLVGFICVTFALWGVQEYLNAGSDPVVARVAGKDIPASEFYRYYSQIERSAQVMGEGIDPAQFERAEFRDTQLGVFAKSQLLEDLSVTSGMRVSDALIVSNVRSTPIFQQEGQFSAQAYQRALQLLGYSSVEYEDRLRDALAVSEFRFGVGGSPLVAEAEARRLAALASETRSLGYVVIRRQQFEEGVALDDAEIETFFNEHQADYRAPEKVDVAYLEITVAGLMQAIEVDEVEIADYYETQRETFVQEERRNVNHILVQVAQDAPEADNEAARSKLAELAERAREGEPFEDLAREYSEDLASQAEGGETGAFPRGVMEPAFEEAAFGLAEVGDISQPVRTKFGWHLMRLKEIEPEVVKPLDEVRDEIARTLAREIAEEEFFAMAERVDAPVFENPETLQVAADELGISVKTTGFKSRDELLALFAPITVEAVFSEDVLEAGLNSLPIDDRDDRIVVVRVSAHEAERPQTLDEVRALVVARLMRENTTKAAQTLGEALIQQMQEGVPAETAAEQAGLNWTEVEDADRRSTDVTRAVLREAFGLRPAEQGSRYAGMTLGSGDYAVIALHAVTRIDPAEVKDSEWKPIEQNLAVMRGNAAWEWVQAELEASHPIEVYPDRL